MASDKENGILRIKNVSGSDYAIEELGGHLISDQEELDLLDTALPSFYGAFADAERAVNGCCENTKLRQDIVAGDIEVTLNQKPIIRRRKV